MTAAAAAANVAAAAAAVTAPTIAQPVPFKLADRRLNHRHGLTIVLKIGTSSICDPVTHLPLLSNLSSVAETIVALKRSGHRVVLVTSGAIGVGLRCLNISQKPKEVIKNQAIAAVGQGKLMSLYDTLFSQFNQPVAQILLTRNDLADRTQYINACNTFEQLLEMDVIPIVNENDTISTAEIKFGDNDTLSAIAAGMVNADYLFLLTDVDCLYTDNPRSNPDAKAVRVVEDIGALREQIKVSAPGTSLGTGGMVTKLIAAELATAAGVTTFIARGSTPGNVIKIVDEVAAPTININVDDIGKSPDLLYTCFLAKRHPLGDRKWWIRHGIHNAGTVVIDRGAARALLQHKGSLFSAGITDVQGNFVAQQGVRIICTYQHAQTSSGESEDAGSEDGQQQQQYVIIGYGLANYSSTEIARIKGHHSCEIADLLGYADAECIVHRDNLARTLSLEEWQQWEDKHPEVDEDDEAH
ncbi:glutamate 5-kinase [Syncephalis pseudoplumigaleata]|uniref:Glutamate 5-kinase n=1 Tax=Syncephalis pseudoplumigaleata TaxID=1712513 RepID=A0A4P9Z2Q2_9FUNG|nr:glutamate 5-kinase [Syncephalis pseudoplumigaleata]|eukprot:RKP26813.1 glutamate 5-kinase [Syncephalis pseudoplumigaleata]